MLAEWTSPILSLSPVAFAFHTVRNLSRIPKEVVLGISAKNRPVSQKLKATHHLEAGTCGYSVEVGLSELLVSSVNNFKKTGLGSGFLEAFP